MDWDYSIKRSMDKHKIDSRLKMEAEDNDELKNGLNNYNSNCIINSHITDDDKLKLILK